jgi:predicted nucleotide-binding protein
VRINVAKKGVSQSTNLPNLVVPRSEASEEIRRQIRKGRRLGNLSTRSIEETRRAQIDIHKWFNYNIELLKRFFDAPSLARQFEKSGNQQISDEPSWREIGRAVKASAESATLFLESLLDRLDLIPEAANLQSAAAVTEEALSAQRDVFVVHGHDDAAKEAVARLIDRLGLRAVILHEQPNLSRTIIEKLERHSAVCFAVVILTPDDVGWPVTDSSRAKHRARQNVILELGYFMGKLGRDKVCALHKGDLELPSDVHGVLYMPMDPNRAWKLNLAKEMRAAGVEVDLSKV